MTGSGILAGDSGRRRGPFTAGQRKNEMNSLLVAPRGPVVLAILVRLFAPS